MVTLEHLGRIEPLTRAMTPVELAEVLLLRLREYEGCRSNAEVLGRTEDLLVSALSIVRSHLSSLSPINCLPPEILSLIFQFIPSVSCDDRHEPVCLLPYTFKNAHDVIAVSHVCRYWRSVALRSALLWTGIDDASPAASSTFLSRSKCAPLQVCMRQSPNPFMQRLFETKGSRIRELYMNIESPRYSPADIIDYLQFPASELEYLTVTADPFCTPTSLDSSESSPILFRGHSPHLRILVLRLVEWMPMNHLPSLTHLHISRCWLPPSRLLKALSGFPSLQKLVLGSIAAAHDDAIVPVVELPDLRLLSLVHMEAAMVKLLLTHVTIPADATLRVWGMNCNQYKLLHRLPRLALTDHLSKLLIKATTSEVQIVASGPSSSGVMFDADGLFYEEWLRAVPAVIPMASIREFSIRINHGMMRCLPELLSLMPSLTSLTLCDGRGDDVRWKEEDFVQISSALGGRNPCPNLTSLRFWFPSPNISTYVSPVAIAASRAAEGCPLQHMMIEYGQQPMENSTDTFLDGALRACVESVELGVSLKRPPMKVPGVCPVKMQDGFWYDW